MNTILSLVILLVVCQLIFKHFFIWKIITLLFNSIKEMFYLLYLLMLHFYKKLCELNKKLYYAMDIHSTKNNKVINFKKRIHNK